MLVHSPTVPINIKDVVSSQIMFLKLYLPQVGSLRVLEGHGRPSARPGQCRWRPEGRRYLVAPTLTRTTTSSMAEASMAAIANADITIYQSFPY